jgi:hypothetical protein
MNRHEQQLVTSVALNTAALEAVCVELRASRRSIHLAVLASAVVGAATGCFFGAMVLRMGGALEVTHNYAQPIGVVSR